MTNKNSISILDAIEKLSKGKLNFRDDLERIIEISIEKGTIKGLEELSFQARYSQGLLSIVKNRDNKIDDEYFARIQKEYMDSILRIKSQIELILGHSSEFIRQVFSEKYFEMNQKSLNNLNLLCNDLSFLKLYLNDLKRSDEQKKGD
ncbi:MAG TPA: hypothetical protein PLZ15_07780 [Melioribacteraceae bacterium]|nr:hypothetical protein [Melioribacteraceae bacterium]